LVAVDPPPSSSSSRFCRFLGRRVSQAEQYLTLASLTSVQEGQAHGSRCLGRRGRGISQTPQALGASAVALMTVQT
jgi:hypothetical protein